jgi:transcriptional regulator with XRE-family HTH domain
MRFLTSRVLSSAEAHGRSGQIRLAQTAVHLTDPDPGNTLISGFKLGAAVKTFGRIVTEARKALGISQKDLAGRILKENGEPISAQYLNDIEHGRRDPPSEFFIEQFARHLKLLREPLIAAAGRYPADIRDTIAGADPRAVEQAFAAFRQVLREQRSPGQAHTVDTMSRDAARHGLLDEVLGFFGGRAQPMMAQLVESGKLTREDIKALETMFERVERQTHKGRKAKTR